MNILKPIRVGNRLVGNRYPCYIIAEIGSNFDGSITQAKKLIRMAKECGADAAKFQSFITERLLSKKGFEKKSSFQDKWVKSVWEVYKNAELPRKWHNELNEYAKKIGIHFFTSTWDFDAVDLLVKLKAPAIKIGSGDITYLEILKYIGSTQKPVILATGASTMNEVSAAVKTIQSTGNNKIFLLHTVVQYPSPPNDTNLMVLDILRRKFNLNIGYSDHSPGSLLALASVALGSCILEKHFTINSKLDGPDHLHSMEPLEFKKMVQDIRRIENAIGDGTKRVMPSEKETRIIQRRGIWTVNKISKGERFTRQNIQALRPLWGISASKYESILGKKSTRNFNSYEPITSL